ncbi:hypothetical protein, partial [Bartonella sp. AU18XJBT]|uniref:hypothetical protein n=1 Tax=Bartonella sp. AU18XJBT TaxID=3019089 RepID=UPI00235E585D
MTFFTLPHISNDKGSPLNLPPKGAPLKLPPECFSRRTFPISALVNEAPQSFCSSRKFSYFQENDPAA